MSDKRRRSKRHRVRECQLSYRHVGVKSILKINTTTVSFPVSDVSQSGLSFVSDKEFETGEKLKVSLDIPAFIKPLKVESEVVWCQKMEGYENYFRIGIRFSKMNKEDRSKLNRLDHDTMLHNVRRDPQRGEKS